MFFLSLSLSFHQVLKETSKVWSLSTADLNDDDIDLIDSDDLLDAEDLKKPDPKSLKGELTILSIETVHS